MILIRLNAEALKRRIIGMSLLPAIVGAYWIAVSLNLIDIKSISISTAASIVILAVYAFFVHFALFKLKNPTVFIINKDRSGVYMPTFKEFRFRVNASTNAEILPDGVRIIPKINGLPNFAEKDGATFIETNKSYDIQRLHG